MAERDLKTTVTERNAHDIENFTGNGVSPGEIINTFGFESLLFVLETGNHTGSNTAISLLIEDGDDAGLSDAEEVADDFLIGTEEETITTTEHTVKSIGYVGKKQYVRASIVVTDHDGDVIVSTIAILGDAVSQPTT